MPVTTLHPDYVAALPSWRRMRDCARGQTAIHAAKERYLPVLYGETEALYAARMARTMFFNATWRTIAGLNGMLFRKNPVTVISAAVKTMLEDVTKAGADWDTFCQSVGRELLTVGRCGVLVDYPRTVLVEGETLTVQQVEAQNLRPQTALYTAESITNWAFEWRNNKTQLTQVVLSELVDAPGTDEFTREKQQQWRVLDLVEGMGYRQRVIIKNKDGVEETVQEFFPMENGARLQEIRFQFFNDDSLSPSVAAPPLEDLAHVNISHYQTIADLEHGAHKTALPQPWIAGVDTKHDENGQEVALELYIGGGSAWAFPRPETTVGMLEYTGQGLAALETRRTSKEAQMAVLGARMLEDQKAGVEAAETAGIHRSGEQATLASLSRLMSKGLTVVLKWFESWAGGDGSATVQVNLDFFPLGMTPQMLTALVASWQQGAISKEALFNKLVQGEVINDTTDFETEEAKIANQPPALLTGAPAPTNEPAPAVA